MPRPPRMVPKSRLTLDLGQPVRDRLERLRVATEADSLTEVIRRSLLLYKTLLEIKGKIIIRDAQGHEKELVLLDEFVEG